jgi:hypothetical protein
MNSKSRIILQIGRPAAQNKPYFGYSILKMEAILSSETWEDFYRTTRCYNPEYCIPQAGLLFLKLVCSRYDAPSKIF